MLQMLCDKCVVGTVLGIVHQKRGTGRARMAPFRGGRLCYPRLIPEWEHRALVYCPFHSPNYC